MSKPTAVALAQITAVKQPSEIVSTEDTNQTEETKMNLNTNTKANPNPNTSIAQKIAQAAYKNSKRANHVFDGQFGGQSGRVSGGMVGGLGGKSGPISGGTVGGRPATKGGMVGGLGAAALSGLSPEAARDILSQRQDKLSALMTGYLRNQAGPVK
jgi:hypothetical protein